MNLHLRIPKQEPGESHWEYSQRLSDHAEKAAKIAMILAGVSVVCAIVALLLP